jgi:L-amino acid N-acyltransferase YncA
MPPRVRRATAADAAACVDIYRPYVLDTAITFETDVPTVQEMANRIVEALAMHEWLVLEVDGNITGYAYAHQFNSRAAYRWSVETSVYLGQDGRRAGGGRMLYAELLRGLAERGSGARSRVSRNPTRPATRCTRCSALRRRVTTGVSGGNSGRGTTSMAARPARARRRGRPAASDRYLSSADERPSRRRATTSC